MLKDLKDEVSVVDGATFVVSDSVGDILPDNGHGFFRSDTRFLSGFVLTLGGTRPRPLSSGLTAHHAAKFYSTNAALEGSPAGTLAVVRERRVNDRLAETISVTNHGSADVALEIALDCRADFADIFEIHSRSADPRPPRVRAGRRDFALRFDFRDAGMRWTSLVRCSQPPKVDGTVLRYEVHLAPRAAWRLQVDVEPYFAQRLPRGTTRADAAEDVKPAPLPLPIGAQLDSSYVPLTRAYDQSLKDLLALRVPHPTGHVVPAAGLPWFMAVFGRDSLITALQTLIVDPQLAYGALRALAQYQATIDDPFRDAESGKIPHEIRHGRLSHLGRVPHSRYYGTVDATPLFAYLLAETVHWTHDFDLARELLPAVNLALDWIDRSGDSDGDGFVEYQRRSPQGLQNQGWKDSHDSINFADGRPATGPIALCEVQGYVYMAKRTLSWMFRELGDGARAEQLQAEASRLRRRFNERFWLAEQGIYALALDGDKRPIDAVTSNMGHCLWSGIVDRDKAPLVAERLMAADMFTGWGVRTLSSNMAAYNPISYHNGSIWPHDNAIVAAGLAAYGFREEASRVIRGVLEAAAHFPDHRLPELFAGFPRGDDDFPVEYPQANAPQAWAAGAVIMMAQTWLGVTLAGDRLRTRPLPGSPAIDWRDVPFRDGRTRLTGGGRTSAAGSMAAVRQIA